MQVTGNLKPKRMTKSRNTFVKAYLIIGQVSCAVESICNTTRTGMNSDHSAPWALRCLEVHGIVED